MVPVGLMANKAQKGQKHRCNVCYLQLLQLSNAIVICCTIVHEMSAFNDLRLDICQEQMHGRTVEADGEPLTADDIDKYILAFH